MVGLKLLKAAVLAAFFMAQAVAETDVPTAVGVWSLTSENDLFGGTDRNYSNGIRLERLRPANRITPGLKWVADRQGFALSHTIFTPENIETETPDPNDRPYAAWLYGSATVVGTTRLAERQIVQDVLQVNLGVVGPSAGGKFVQENWQDLIQAIEPRGWD